MQGFLLNYRVGTRLGAAFAILIAIAISLVAAGLVALGGARSNLDAIVGENMLKIRLSSEMLDANAAVVTDVREILLHEDPQQRAPYMEHLLAQRKKYADADAALSALPASETGQSIRARIHAHRATSLELNTKVLDSAMAGDLVQARELLVGGAADSTRQWQAAIRENIAYQQKTAERAYADAQQQIDRGHSMLVSGGVAAVLCSVLLAWLITRSLTRPLAHATQVANAIARGEVDDRIHVQGRDETARLLQSMAAMQAQLTALLAAQREMAGAHEQGQMRYRMDDTGVPGAFGQLVRDSNALVERNVQVMLAMADVAQQYAVGKLDVQLQRLPGEQAMISDAMDRTRDNLLAIDAQIQRLALAAAAGDFGQRGDADAFQYNFRQMLDNLNAMFDVSDRSLGAIARLLDAIAAGDLASRIDGDFNGVFAAMRDSANRSSDQLSTIVRGIQDGAEQITASASEISLGNSDLSRRTEQQAANLEETAASMEELTSTVRQNADHARQANQLAIGAGEVASRGGEIVAQVVTTMDPIESSSRRIGDIISVIDGIAFQTNILALNAAVEAARAGEQGRGFAVVATEVRVLAQRSAEAARQIKGLVTSSMEDVSRGAGLVRDAGTTMQDIVTAVQRVNNIMAEISAASQEQSAGIEQVNQAVVAMDETTQQNAALVEEASAAARAMEEQALQLREAVAVFRLASSQPDARASTPSAPAASSASALQHVAVAA